MYESCVVLNLLAEQNVEAVVLPDRAVAVGAPHQSQLHIL